MAERITTPLLMETWSRWACIVDSELFDVPDPPPDDPLGDNGPPQHHNTRNRQQRAVQARRRR